MVFAYDVVLCAREEGVLEIELEQWRENQEKRGETNESVKSVDGITGGRCRRGGVLCRLFDKRIRPHG